MLLVKRVIDLRVARRLPQPLIPGHAISQYDNSLYLDFVGEDRFYGFLARHARELFCGEGYVEGLRAG